ncbi:BCCT family transporter [Salinicoccus cyprini]|uniref:BCCT family transporter n=1 Tax=Salinicoccus cyprini TaxID=2493691 RepID=A0A558ASM0_9STAP|nr:BCCT family transporter [Salinicoccus cyprini]TVT27262.1 BCCT family transporter [Salinicoccus cyprini]
MVNDNSDKTSKDKWDSNRKSKLGLVFWASTIIILVAAIFAAAIPESFQTGSEALYAWIANYFSWFFMIAVFGFAVFLLFLALSPYGRIKLGGDQSKPEFSFRSWIGMLFSAGLGVGLVFFGVAEPMSHYMVSPFLGGETESVEAARMAMGYSFFHWGISQWSIFGVAGLAIGYNQYRKQKDGLVSTSLEPLLGSDYNKKARKTIDILAVIATVTGMATSVGLGILQMDGGLNIAYGIPSGPLTQIILTALMTGLFILSTTTGLKRGIKWLSNLNMLLAAVITIFVMAVGPFTFIMESIIVGLGDYLSNYVGYSLRMQPYSGEVWVQEWTVFYWAWVIAWSPFIGSFVARVSRGRTIREYVLGILIIPPMLSFIWIGALGGTAIYSDLFNGTNIGVLVLEDDTAALFALYDQLPMTQILSALSILLIFTFLVTSADSATFIVAGMTSGNTEAPATRLKIIWGVLIGTLTVTLIIAGGLTSLQAASLLAGLPFGVVLIAMIASVSKSLRREPNEAMKRRVRKAQKES